MSSVLPRLLALTRYLIGFTVLLALIAIVLASAWSSVRDEPDRCSESKWVHPHDVVGVDELARCAAGGSVSAQIRYGGELFRNGRQEEAETWFEAAVASVGTKHKGGVATNIASSLDPGLKAAGRDDTRAAERWYRRAFELGSFTGAVQLGLLLRRVGDPNEADHWFEQAVERSGGYAASLIAVNLSGRRNRPQSADEAALSARWLRRGAELGDKTSMSTYAKALSAGVGVERSETEAFRWYEAAAQHPRASVWDPLRLAELHVDGKGTSPNREAALAALTAAKGKTLDDGDTTTPDRIKRLERRLNAAEADRR